MKIELTVEELKELVKITPIVMTTDVDSKLGAEEIGKIILQQSQR